MYREHFGLSHLPFQDSPSTQFYYPALDAEQALVGVSKLLAQPTPQDKRGVIVAIVADTGFGKTLLGRKLTEGIRRSRACVFLTNPPPHREEFMRQLCIAFDESLDEDTTTGEMVGRLQHSLTRQQTGASVAAVVIDDAQRLDARVLNLLAMLVELRAGDRPLLRAVLVGDARLSDQLSAPSASSCGHRVRATYRLGPMSRPETQAYIDHRLAVAGCTDGQLMAPAVSSAIHDRSGGVPRLINRLADATLLSAFVDGRMRVTIDDLPAAGPPEQSGEATANAEPRGISATRPTVHARRPRKARSPDRCLTPAAALTVLERQLLSTAEWLGHRLHAAVEHLCRRAWTVRRSVEADSGSPASGDTATGVQPARSRSILRWAMADFGDSLASLRRLGARRRTPTGFGAKR